MMISHNVYYVHRIDLLSYPGTLEVRLVRLHNTDAIQTLCHTLEHVRLLHVKGKFKRTPT